MGTVRTLIGYVKGPKGDTGATGATGPQGPAGQNGAPGVTDYATTEAAGLVRVGDDFEINSSNGTLSIKNLFTTASTLAKMVSEEAFATSLGKIAKAVDWVVDNAPNFFNKNTDIVDGLTSSLTNKALSANAGKALKDGLDSLNDSFTGISPTSQYPTGVVEVNGTFQLSDAVLAHSVIIISAGRYGYGGAVVLAKGAIASGLYTSGCGIYINANRKIGLKINGTGLLTITEAPDPVNIYIYGIF